MLKFDAMPAESIPEAKKSKPVIVKKIDRSGKITEEEILPVGRARTAPPGLDEKSDRSKPKLEVVSPEAPAPSARDIIRVQSASTEGRRKESVYEKGKKVLESEKRNPWNVQQVIPAPELAPQEAIAQQPATSETPFAEIATARSWDQLMDTFNKLDVIEDNGAIYHAPYFIDIARSLQTQVEGEEYTEDSPLFDMLPEKYGIRAKFLELLKATKPLTKAEIVFPEKIEPLKPAPASAEDIEPIPILRRPDFAPLPEVPVVEELPKLEPLTSQDVGMTVEFGFEAPAERLSEDFPNQYKSSSEYQDLSDRLNTEAEVLAKDFESWAATTQEKNPEKLQNSPYFKEFAAKRNQARVAARLADRLALQDMLEQENAELSNSQLENPGAVDMNAFETVARMDEIKRERRILAEEVVRLDNEFMELDVNIQIQRHKKESGFTPAEERALNDVATFYTKLNETQQQLQKEKGGFLNRVKSFFSADKKKQVESLEDIARAYQSRLTQAQESANVARKARATRLAARSKTAVKG
jgi:hypothetical protein